MASFTKIASGTPELGPFELILYYVLYISLYRSNYATYILGHADLIVPKKNFLIWQKCFELSFKEIFQIFVTMFSKSSDSDLLYVGKG